MAEPLLSLLTPGTMKHVVPWKTRSDFLTVYKDLYSYDVKCQESAIGRIAAWKSRVGNKLSVAIESSGMLMNVRIQHLAAERDGKLGQIEHQLCYSYSLALIRFVNHITEKAQTKAVAQPVHLVAREFGIPEWIVRLRHDATHAALPCLDALAAGTKWALDYLQQNFWEQQTDDNLTGAGDDEDKKNSKHNSSEPVKSPKTADIRRSFYEFQKLRYQKINSGSEDKAEYDHTAVLGKLQKYLSQDRLKFMKCLLEDGILIAIEEQLQAFGVDSAELLTEFPPTIPQQMALFWRPLLKRICNAGALAFLLQTAMFSVTSEHGMRNYQLVAWIAFILANTSTEEARGRGKRKKHRKQDCFMKTTHSIPTRTLFSACIQNLNGLTVHLLRHIMDPDNLGPELHAKLTQLLGVAPSIHQRTGLPIATDPLADTANDSSSSSASDSDSDTAYTLQGSRSHTVKADGSISTATVEDIRKIFEHNRISWNLCTDMVDWSKVPLGTLPDQPAERSSDVSSNDLTSDDDDGGGGGDKSLVRKRSSTKSRHRRRRERRGDGGTSKDEEDDEDEEEDESDDPDHDTPPKRSKLIVTDQLLI